MKHGKKPTRTQRQLIKDWHLNSDNWLVVKDTPDGMTIMHRHSGKTRTIPKYRKESYV